MPEISRFYGVVIAMFHNDHAPPHFHATYAGEEAAVRLDTLEVQSGALSPRALRLVREWASLHREELMRAWDMSREGKPPQPIPPLR